MSGYWPGSPDLGPLYPGSGPGHNTADILLSLKNVVVHPGQSPQAASPGWGEVGAGAGWEPEDGGGQLYTNGYSPPCYTGEGGAGGWPRSTLPSPTMSVNLSMTMHGVQYHDPAAEQVS